MHHNEMSHVGTEKTVRNILNSYWFPEMKTKVERHVKNCLKCIAFTPNTGRLEGSLHSIPKGDVLFDTIHVDHLAPASRSNSHKNHYIFLVVDAFMKYLKLYATKTTNAAEIIKCLKSYFEHYSRPLRLVSDRGSCFMSHEFDEFLTNHNVHHIQVATASPQANGQVERFNRTILPMIAKLSDERNTPWYNVVSDVEFACNNTASSATNKCPSKLLFGIVQRGKVIDNLRDALEADEREKPTHDLPQIRKRASEQTKRRQDANKDRYDHRHKTANKYQAGDKVMIKNFDNSPGVSVNMIPKYKGPYQVERVLRNDRYVIKDVDEFQLSQTPYHGTWEASNMRPWTPGKLS